MVNIYNPLLFAIAPLMGAYAFVLVIHLYFIAQHMYIDKTANKMVGNGVAVCPVTDGCIFVNT